MLARLRCGDLWCGCALACWWAALVVTGISATGISRAAGREPSKSAGPSGQSTQADSFENDIAPLLARHCLECHDTSSMEGGLDLSRKSKAFAGGENGLAIRPGSSAESLVWQYVESDEMPKNRAALSDDEKSRLRRWIDSGANWTVDSIDAEAYCHSSHATGIWLQRLTVSEYIQTVRDSVGVDIAEEARRLLPRDQRADGFTNTAYNLSVDLLHVEAYERLARLIVSRMDVDAFAAQHVDCRQLDERCMSELIRGMGKQLFRGPLRDEEVKAFLTISTAVEESGGNFSEAAAFIVQAMLQSPRFLFRLEQQRGDGTPQLVDDFELAARLSYILWGAPPDQELLRVADRGNLNDPSQIGSQVERMLRDPRAVSRSLRFVSDWLNLERLRTLQPNSERFPAWNPELAADMRDETLQFFEDLVWKQERPLAELMNAQFTYATPRLASHYGLIGSQPASAGVKIASRVSDGLRALYTFREGAGDTIRDVSGSSNPLHLTIPDSSSVRWNSQGLDIHGMTMIASPKPPADLIRALKKSNAITLEAWVTPADTVQAGPARILTLSNGVLSRNFTLGQDGDHFEIRLRTTNTSDSGIPAVTSKSGSAAAAPRHVVYTRDRMGDAVVYIDGQESGRASVSGDFSNWDEKFLLGLGNEFSRDRPWRGTLHLVAVYDVALSAQQARQNHAAGAGLTEDRLALAQVAAAWHHADKRDLIALYRFDERQGDVIRDQSQAGDALDLKIEKPQSVKWGPTGLAVYDSTLIQAQKPSRRLVEAVKESKAFSVEAWVTPNNTSQSGPARIVTISAGISQRNFTLGQERDRYEFRVRAGKTDLNGLPGLTSRNGSGASRLTHLVFTTDPSGHARLYVDGEEHAVQDIGSKLDAWDSDLRLALANETSQDRPWLGTYHLIAIYKRALTPEEVRRRGGDGFTRYDLAQNPTRGGLLTQGSVLTIGGDNASMVARGLFVMHDLLDGRVGNPPATVDTTPIPTKPGLSMRRSAEIRLADASCMGCHAKFEPLAFGLEKFDGIGAYHENDEHGNKLREDGEVRFPGSDQPIRYQTAAELMDVLAHSDRVRSVITRKLTQFALGRPLNADDLAQADKIHARAEQQGGTYRAVMTAILTSDLIRRTHTEPE